MSGDGRSEATDRPDGDERSSAAGGDRTSADDRGGKPEREAAIDVLEAENRRLREEYARAKQAQYHRSALGLLAVGVLAGLGALLFPAARTVLFALAGTGLFLGVLTYYLAPEQFLPASLGRSVYDTLARNESAVVAELGLQDERIYVPTDAGVRLFVPQHQSHDLPATADLADLFVVGPEEATRGVAFHPTGAGLLAEVDRALPDGLAEDPETLATQLTDAVTDQFELAERAGWDHDVAGNRTTVGVSGGTYGDLDRFDHPAVSTLAAGFARGLDRPVTCRVDRSTDDRAPFLVTCTWDDASDDAAGESQ